MNPFNVIPLFVWTITETYHYYFNRTLSGHSLNLDINPYFSNWIINFRNTILKLFISILLYVWYNDSQYLPLIIAIVEWYCVRHSVFGIFEYYFVTCKMLNHVIILQTEHILRTFSAMHDAHALKIYFFYQICLFSFSYYTCILLFLIYVKWWTGSSNSVYNYCVCR